MIDNLPAAHNNSHEEAAFARPPSDALGGSRCLDHLLRRPSPRLHDDGALEPGLALEVPARGLGQEAGALDLVWRLVIGLERFVMRLGIHHQPRLPATHLAVPADPGYAALVDRLLLRLARVLEDALLDELLAPGDRGLQRRLGGLLVGAPIRHVVLCGEALMHEAKLIISLPLKFPRAFTLFPNYAGHAT
eukprot:CAMPEP_0177261662 /NCGR_PEP_ID=MMETSP0367-20130122/59947_1 /TAXON_ID=447022 ORGANISM="Scrippsiella hangoei-like, Strain SHHI-4" /NCGR_SAMPLE_ID=MMETSP0367 /ASSEMBLY_ACC=CAM_ASM_000362 /LENGTH=190 /DNA_ID=CAMNT_0018716333 /DNA_START=192 /DNA_END=765 /DNA_ORIENTATION=-